MVGGVNHCNYLDRANRPFSFFDFICFNFETGYGTTLIKASATTADQNRYTFTQLLRTITP
jgi:hypothetical protein